MVLLEWASAPASGQEPLFRSVISVTQPLQYVRCAIMMARPFLRWAGGMGVRQRLHGVESAEPPKTLSRRRYQKPRLIWPLFSLFRPSWIGKIIKLRNSGGSPGRRDARPEFPRMGIPLLRGDSGSGVIFTGSYWQPSPQEQSWERRGIVQEVLAPSAAGWAGGGGGRRGDGRGGGGVKGSEGTSGPAVRAQGQNRMTANWEFVAFRAYPAPTIHPSGWAASPKHASKPPAHIGRVEGRCPPASPAAGTQAGGGG